MKMSEYALRFIGSPYAWGGDGHAGFDCSGLVLECLWGCGLYRGGDTTAQGLRDMMRLSESWELCSEELPDSVIFFGKDSSRITHCAVGLGGGLMVEAGGGGRDSKSGMVRIRPVEWRRDLVEAWKRV